MSNSLSLIRSERGALVAHTDPEQTLAEWEDAFAKQLNVSSPEVAKSALRQYLAAMGLGRSSPINEVNAALHTLQELQPRDILELNLMVQMLTASQQSLKLLGEAAMSTFPETKDLYLGLSARLMRLFSKQLTALGKYRNQAQTIRIERVSLDGNSQAVFGLTPSGGG